jgi:hypothetical protein
MHHLQFGMHVIIVFLLLDSISLALSRLIHVIIIVISVVIITGIIRILCRGLGSCLLLQPAQGSTSEQCCDRPSTTALDSSIHAQATKNVGPMHARLDAC